MPGNQSTPVSTSNTSAETSASSTEVAVVSASSSLSALASLEPSPAFFKGVATHVVENIINCLPTYDKGFRAFFRVIAATKVDDSYESARQGVVNGMQAQFLHDVADAEMKSVEAILKLAMVNKLMFRKLITTSKNIIQKNGLIVKGSALEIALKCWDWSSCEGGQEEMAEMLMRYMRMLPEGEALIQNSFTKLFPGGNEVHQEDQAKRANEFAESILEPLAKTLKGASDEDIALVYAITGVDDNKVDEYINKNLLENKLWQALMLHFDAIKDFMTEDNVYNPYYLQKAFEIVGIKYENGDWANLSKGNDRLALLTIHGVGGVQACSPTIVGMLFARGGIIDFYDLDESKRKQFKVDRNSEFKSGGGDVFARSVDGVLLVSNKFWLGVARRAQGAPSMGLLLWRCMESICQTKKCLIEESDYEKRLFKETVVVRN